MIFTKIKVDATIALFPSEDTVSERLKPTPGTSAVLNKSVKADWIFVSPANSYI